MSKENIYTIHVGKKFNQDGSFRKYPGLTIISKIETDTIESNMLKQWQQELMEIPFAKKFAFLPPKSFHMTVFELLNDQAREGEIWSEKLPLDASMTIIDNFMTKAIKDLKRPDKIKMKVNGCISRSFIVVSLSPYSPEQFQVLKKYRDQLSEKTGLRKPNHDDYKYHISFAYKLSRA